MPYTSLTALPRVYPFEGNLGGLGKKLYIVAYEDLVPDGTGTPATVVSNIVTAIALAEDKFFVGVELLKASSDFTSDFTKDFSKGTGFFKSTLKIFLSGLTVANQTFIQQLLMRPVAIIFQTRVGSYYFIGGDGRFELLSVQEATGTAEGDAIGYTLSFESTGLEIPLMVDPSIIATVTGA